MREIAGIVSACVCLSQVWARAKEEYDNLGGVRLSTEKKFAVAPAIPQGRDYNNQLPQHNVKSNVYPSDFPNSKYSP